MVPHVHRFVRIPAGQGWTALRLSALSDEEGPPSFSGNFHGQSGSLLGFYEAGAVCLSLKPQDTTQTLPQTRRCGLCTGRRVLFLLVAYAWGRSSIWTFSFFLDLNGDSPLGPRARISESVVVGATIISSLSPRCVPFDLIIPGRCSSCFLQTVRL